VQAEKMARLLTVPVCDGPFFSSRSYKIVLLVTVCVCDGPFFRLAATKSFFIKTSALVHLVVAMVVFSAVSVCVPLLICGSMAL